MSTAERLASITTRTAERETVDDASQSTLLCCSIGDSQDFGDSVFGRVTDFRPRPGSGIP